MKCFILPPLGEQDDYKEKNAVEPKTPKLARLETQHELS